MFQRYWGSEVPLQARPLLLIRSSLKRLFWFFIYIYIYYLSNTFLRVLSEQEVHSFEGELAQKEGFSWLMYERSVPWLCSLRSPQCGSQSSPSCCPGEHLCVPRAEMRVKGMGSAVQVMVGFVVMVGLMKVGCDQSLTWGTSACYWCDWGLSGDTGGGDNGEFEWRGWVGSTDLSTHRQCSHRTIES